MEICERGRKGVECDEQHLSFCVVMWVEGMDASNQRPQLSLEKQAIKLGEHNT